MTRKHIIYILVIFENWNWTGYIACLIIPLGNFVLGINVTLKSYLSYFFLIHLLKMCTHYCIHLHYLLCGRLNSKKTNRRERYGSYIFEIGHLQKIGIKCLNIYMIKKNKHTENANSNDQTFEYMIQHNTKV